MLRKLLSLISVTILVISGWSAHSQDIYKKYDIQRNPLRVFLNKFSWTFSSGLGTTQYKHSLSGFTFAQDPFGQFITTNSSQSVAVFSGYQNWLSGNVTEATINLDDIFDTPYQPVPYPVGNESIGNVIIAPVNADSVGLSFSSLVTTIPVNAEVYFNLKKFRLGFGYQWERHIMSPLKPSVETIRGILVRDYQPEFNKTSYTKIYGMVGYRFYEWWDYTFALEVRLGRGKAGKEINTSALAIGQNFFSNIGLNIEKNISEYLRVIIRPGIDFKSYVVNIPGDQASSIRHYNKSFIINFGVSINIPEIPRSPIKSDHIQLKHVITDPKSGKLKEVRGQPFWKVQNPKVGQNHRKLWRYKWKNRRKIHPY